MLHFIETIVIIYIKFYINSKPGMKPTFVENFGQIGFKTFEEATKNDVRDVQQL